METLATWFATLLNNPQFIVTAGGVAQNTGLINFSKMFTPPNADTPASQDPEYVQAVQADKTQRYNALQSVTSKVSSSDTATIEKIKTVWNNFISAWGDPSNPPRNSPAVLSARQEVDSLVSSLQNYTAPASTVLDSSSLSEAIKALFGTTNTATPQVAVSSQTQTPAQTQGTDYTGIVIIAGVVLIAIMLLTRKGK
jgi:hypothetical protein